MAATVSLLQVTCKRALRSGTSDGGAKTVYTVLTVVPSAAAVVLVSASFVTGQSDPDGPPFGPVCRRYNGVSIPDRE